MSAPWRPSPVQEQLLAACLGGEPPTLAADALDPAARALLPLLYRRRPGAAGELAALGRKLYLTNWRQNQERMAELLDLVAALENGGIPVLALKGAALLLRYYRDFGVRAMRDFDLLVPDGHLESAVAQLERFGWIPEGHRDRAAILRRARVGHAWQFSRGPDTCCDLHWRPVVRCFSPELTELFWHGAEGVPIRGRTLKVPCPTDQLFHVCAHGLQWDWTPQVRWIADALTVLADPIDWDRLCRLASAASMRARLHEALLYLHSRFAAPVPASTLRSLLRSAPRWERHEYRLLLRPCPLGPLDTVAWHCHHFRRIRPFDAAWRRAPVWVGFPQYVAAFLGARTLPETCRRLAAEMRGRWA